MKRALALICVLVCLSVLCLPVMAAEDTITVYVDAPSDWTQVNLYVWTRDNGADTPLTDWPGTPMTEAEDGWYALEVPAGNNYVIANNGTNQTVDLEMDGTIDAWLTVTAPGSDGKFGGDILYVNPGPALDDMPTEPAEPADPVELESLALVGDGIPGLQSWIVEDPAGDMELVSEGVYSKEIAVTAGTSMQFKVAGNDTWDSPYNFGGSEDPTAVTLGTSVALVSGNESKNLSLTVEKSCTLKFTVTITDDSAALLVEEVAGTVVEPQPTEPAETKPQETKPAQTEPAETTAPTTAQNGTTTEEPKGNNDGLVLAIVLVVVAATAVGAFIVVKKKISK